MPFSPIDVDPSGKPQSPNDLVSLIASDRVFTELLANANPSFAMDFVQQAFGEQASTEKGGLAIIAAGLSTTPEVYVNLVSNAWARLNQP